MAEQSNVAKIESEKPSKGVSKGNNRKLNQMVTKTEINVRAMTSDSAQ